MLLQQHCARFELPASTGFTPNPRQVGAGGHQHHCCSAGVFPAPPTAGRSCLPWDRDPSRGRFPAWRVLEEKVMLEGLLFPFPRRFLLFRVVWFWSWGLLLLSSVWVCSVFVFLFFKAQWALRRKMSNCDTCVWSWHCSFVTLLPPTDVVPNLVLAGRQLASRWSWPELKWLPKVIPVFWCPIC